MVQNDHDINNRPNLSDNKHIVGNKTKQEELYNSDSSDYMPIDKALKLYYGLDSLLMEFGKIYQEKSPNQNVDFINQAILEYFSEYMKYSGEPSLKSGQTQTYVAPSRIGRRSLNAHLLSDLYDAFKKLSIDTGKTTDYLSHEAYALLLEKYNKPVPDAVQEHLAHPEPRRRGPAKGTPRTSRRALG